MKMVTDTAPASASPSDAPRVPPTASEPTSAVTGYPASTAPFTDVLSEQTSKALRDGLNKSDKSEKKEPAESLPSSSPARPVSSSKKTVVVDPSTQLLMVPIVPLVPTEVANTASVRVGAGVTPLIEASHTSQVAIAANLAKGDDSKASTSPLEVDTSTHPGLSETSFPGTAPTKAESSALPGIPATRTMGLGENATPSSGVPTKLGENASLPGVAPIKGESVTAPDVPAARVAAVGENMRPLGAGDRSAASTSVTGSTKLITTDQGQSTEIPRSLGGDNVVKVAPEIGLSQGTSATAGSEAKPEHQRAASTHVTSRFVEPVSGAVSSPLVHSQPLDASVSLFSPMPASPISALGSGAGVNASAHIAQSTPHSLDVGALAGAISRPLNEGNGSYRVVIAMHPADLGQLQAVVTLHGNDLHVSITPQTQIGRDALANAVDTLKNELSHGGMNVNVTLHDFGSQSRGEDRPQVAAVQREPFPLDESAGMSPLPPALAASQIHLIL